MSKKKFEDTAIIIYGRGHIADYEEQEFRESFDRFFRGNDKDASIVLDSNPTNHTFLAAAMAWAIDRGFLGISKVVDEGQTINTYFKLTKEGQKEFLPHLHL